MPNTENNVKNGKAIEHLFASEMMLRGYSVLQPLDESNDYDFVVYNGKEYLKVQVRSVNNIKHNPRPRYCINFPKENKDVDVVACYFGILKLWYFIPFKTLGLKNGSLCIPLGEAEPSKYDGYKENWRVFDGTKNITFPK